MEHAGTAGHAGGVRWRGIVEAHAGRSDVLSRPGEGARFTITLPAS